MLLKEFDKSEILINTLKTYPEFNIHIYNNVVHTNREHLNEGDFSNLEKNIPQGYISLYEYNVNRDKENHTSQEPRLIHPFITKEGARTAFKTITTSNFADSSQFNFGDKISGKYPLSASVNRVFIESGTDISLLHFENFIDGYVPESGNKKYIRSLKNILNANIPKSQHFAYSSSLGKKGEQRVNMICIPSIMYGTRIEPGSLNLKFFVNGSILAEAKDENKNGEIIQTTGAQSGSVAGVALYDYGFLILTGAWALDNGPTEHYLGDGESAEAASWLHYGSGLPYTGPVTYSFGSNITSGFSLNYKGVNKVPTMTLFAHSEKGEHNFSNNSTYIQHKSGSSYSISENMVVESSATIKNITKSPYTAHSSSYKNTTYISKIGIYDENKNLIAIAKLANPVKNTDNKDYTFKLQMDF
jgi:hypothetical protein